MQHPNLLKKPLNKDVGLPGLPSNTVMPDLLLHNKMAQGRILNSHFVQAMQIVASTVEVPLTLLKSVLKQDSQIRGKALIRTRIGRRQSRSGKDGLISPLLQNFLKEHQ
jgi:hypothetical protein